MFYLCSKRLNLIFVIFFGINGIFRWNLLNLTIGFEMIFLQNHVQRVVSTIPFYFCTNRFSHFEKKKKTTITETNPNESIFEKWNERFHNNCAKAWPEEIKRNRFENEEKTVYIQKETTLWWSDIMLLVCLCSMCEFGWSRCISLLFISKLFESCLSLLKSWNFIDFNSSTNIVVYQLKNFTLMIMAESY